MMATGRPTLMTALSLVCGASLCQRRALCTLVKPARAPRGWNSFDSVGSADEAVVRRTIAALQRGVLGPTADTGYEYVEMDGFWFSSHTEPNSESLDSFGRPCPGPDKYPSLNCSLKPLADAAHAAGLKIGIWQLFGVPKGAVTSNMPILGTNYTARDIALNESCGWAEWEGYSVNMSHPAGQMWYDSLVELWALWGVDLVKLDCVFGGNWTPQRFLEIKALSQAIARSSRPMVLSLSPGGDVTPDKLASVASLATTARMAVDLHGEWYEVAPQFFQIADKFHSRVPCPSCTDPFYLDFDILPFGKGKEMHLQINEMRVVMTLWSLLRSPLVFGGAIADGIAPAIASIVTNKQVLAMTDDVVSPTPLPKQNPSLVGWVARSHSNHSVRYVAVFDLGNKFSGTGHSVVQNTCDARAYNNNTCFHNPHGKIAGQVVGSASQCCRYCSEIKQCEAWSAFHDGKSLACNVFRSVGKVNFVRGCTSGGAKAPAPAPTPAPPFTGFRVTLEALGLSGSTPWKVKSIWDTATTHDVPITNGSFLSFPKHHDVDLFLVSPG